MGTFIFLGVEKDISAAVIFTKEVAEWGTSPMKTCMSTVLVLDM